MAIDMLHVLYSIASTLCTSNSRHFESIDMLCHWWWLRCAIKWKREQSMHLIKASKSNRNMQYSSFGLITISLHCMNCTFGCVNSINNRHNDRLCVIFGRKQSNYHALEMWTIRLIALNFVRLLVLVLEIRNIFMFQFEICLNSTLLTSKTFSSNFESSSSMTDKLSKAFHANMIISNIFVK